MAHKTKELVTPQECSYVTLPYREKIRDMEGKRYRESQVEHQLPVLSKSQSTPARVCYIYGTGYIHFNLTGIKRVYLITWTLLYLNNLQGKLLYLLQGVI